MVKLKAKDIVTIGFLTAAMEAAKLSLAAFANIELVSLLVVIFTIVFRKKIIFILTAFNLLEGLLYGFGIWWISYLYIWPLLALAAYLLRRNTSHFFWSVILGIYGLTFGALCSIPYFLAGGFHTGMAYWIAGIPFDIAHCIGNFFLTLISFKPLYKLFSYLDAL